MMLTDGKPIPQLGQLVRVTQGRDAGKVGIVISHLDNRYVMIADGEKRKFDCPKLKNLLHVEPIEYIAHEVQQSLKQTGRVSNGKLRYAINKYFVEAETES